MQLGFIDSGLLEEEIRSFLLDEVEAIFDRSGIRVLQIWEPRGWSPSRGHLLRVVVTDKDPLIFGIRRDALAAIRGTDFPRSVVFVFYPRLLQEIDAVAGRGSRGTSAEIGRALAVVVTHEAVHALAPDQEHSLKGVMDRELERGELLQSLAELEAEEAEALCEGLRALGNSR